MTVWLASYPRSGNTWLRALFTAWRRDGPVDLNNLEGHPIASSRAYFDLALGIPSSSLTPAEVDLLRPRVDDLLASEADEPQLRKIHDAFGTGPEGTPIVSVAATRAAIYIVRDPRDVAVSYAVSVGRPTEWARRHLNDSDAALGENDDQLPDQLRQRLGAWSEHVRSWVDETPFPVEVVRYEDLAADPVATFGRALRCAGFANVDGERVAEAVERAGFRRLREAERHHGFPEQLFGTRQFFRRGEAGSWPEELQPEVAAGIADDHADVMARFGYR
jgi:aryl sulfotransferase